MKRLLILLTLAFATVSCGQQQAEEPPAAAAAAVDPSIYSAALASPSRLAGDRDRDTGRKPDQVLAFFGIAPGMTVLDLFSGGGYYSEILSRVVGPDGTVVAHTNSAYLNFVGEEFAARYADGRLPNVTVLTAENNELQLDADRFDAIMMVLAYHDIYWVAPEQGWPQIDVPRLHAELYKSLKPGGILAIVDHYAVAGSPRSTGSTVHRIDPAIVKEELQLAGFTLDAESDLLRNPDDDHSKNVFDPAIRGNTDRFMLRFRKPE